MAAIVAKRLVAHFEQAGVVVMKKPPAVGAAALGRGADGRDGSARLSPSGDLEEAGARLFAYLRALDDSGAARIAAAPIPERGLGVAINDRLRRAAAPHGGDA
jgi:L-threonylcarbamoyladenylate synthase